MKLTTHIKHRPHITTFTEVKTEGDSKRGKALKKRFCNGKKKRR